MGEAKTKEKLEAEAWEELKAASQEKVEAKDILLAGCAMSVLGQFQFTAIDPEYGRQLQGYWQMMARGCNRPDTVPACFHRIRAFGMLAADSQTIRDLMGIVKNEESGMVGLPILSDEFCAVVAAMPIEMRAEDDPGLALCPIKAKVEETVQLVRLYCEIGGTA